MGGPAFKTAPAVEKVEGKYVVTFRVTEATNVEAAVVDAEGNVLRHLAAGVLGETAPAPLLKGSLAQRIVWDGADDSGKPAAGAARVRVRIGTSPRLQHYLGRSNSAARDFIAGLTVGPEGEVYVLLTNQTYGRTELRVLDRSGRYLRTLLPYPAGTPEGRLTSIGRLRVGDERLPIVFNAHAHAVAPLMAGMKRQSMRYSPKGHVVLASAVGTITSHGPPRHLLAVHPGGRCAGRDGLRRPDASGGPGLFRRRRRARCDRLRRNRH